MTCEDEAVRNKYYNLLDSFFHKSEGKILHSISEDANAITLQFIGGNSPTANTSVVIPKLPNSKPISFINGLQDALNGKVDKVPGQRLTEQNYTLAEKQKLAALQNYIPPNSVELAYVEGLVEALEEKVDKVAGKGLSTNDYTNAEAEIVSNVPTTTTTSNTVTFRRNTIHGTKDIPIDRVEFFITATSSVGNVAQVWFKGMSLPENYPIPYTDIIWTDNADEDFEPFTLYLLTFNLHPDTVIVGTISKI